MGTQEVSCRAEGPQHGDKQHGESSELGTSRTRRSSTRLAGQEGAVLEGALSRLESLGAAGDTEDGRTLAAAGREVSAGGDKQTRQSRQKSRSPGLLPAGPDGSRAIKRTGTSEGRAGDRAGPSSPQAGEGTKAQKGDVRL